MSRTQKPVVSGRSRQMKERWTREEAIAEIGRYRSSGLSMKDYAAQTGVNMNILRGWAAQLRGSKVRPAAKAAQHTQRAFVQVEVDGGLSAPPAVSEILLSNGVRLVLPTGLKMQELRALLDVLGGGSC